MSRIIGLFSMVFELDKFKFDLSESENAYLRNVFKMFGFKCPLTCESITVKSDLGNMLFGLRFQVRVFVRVGALVQHSCS